MAEQTMRDELNDVKQHAKEAVRSTLLAMRTAVDFALNKLDGEPAPPNDGAGAGRASARDAADEAPPPANDDAV